MEKVKCLICKKRYSTQDLWKTQREKELCFTCFCMEKSIIGSIQILQIMANEKGLEIFIDFTIKPIK
jgi:hypothetical protein